MIVASGASSDHSVAAALVARERVLAIAHVAAFKGQDATCAQRIDDLFGLRLPARPERVVRDQVSALGIGPGRWLITREGPGHDFGQAVATLLESCAAVSEVSDAFAIWQLEGVGVRALLSRLVAIDVHEREFVVGRCAQTVAAHMGVMLWRLEDARRAPVFALAVARSYAESFSQAMSAAAGPAGIRFEPA